MCRTASVQNSPRSAAGQMHWKVPAMGGKVIFMLVVYLISGIFSIKNKQGGMIMTLSPLAKGTRVAAGKGAAVGARLAHTLVDIDTALRATVAPGAVAAVPGEVRPGTAGGMDAGAPMQAGRRHSSTST